MKFNKFSSSDRVPPKIIKNRLNFAPTHVYTAGKIQIFNKKLEFFKIFIFKFTPPIMLYPLGTDAVAVHGFQPKFDNRSEPDTSPLEKNKRYNRDKFRYI